MNRLGKYFAGARMFWERWVGCHQIQMFARKVCLGARWLWRLNERLIFFKADPTLQTPPWKTDPIVHWDRGLCRAFATWAPLNFWLKSFLLQVILGGSIIGVAEGASLNPQFVDLLNGNIPIKYFKVGFSGDLFIVNEKPLTEWVYYEGSIQKDTFWISNCTNSVPRSGQIPPGDFIGMSFSEYWSYKEERFYLSERKSKIPSPLDKRAEGALRMARQALGLGAVLEKGSLIVKDDNTFEAKVKGGEIIKGKFEVATTGYPTRCEYSGTIIPTAKAVVTYTYSGTNSSTCLPTTHLVVSVANLLKEVDRAEYQILSCEFGNANLPRDGYTVDSMTNWGPLNLKMRDKLGTVIFRDGEMYTKAPDGSLKLLSRAAANEQVRTNNTRVFFVTAIVVSTILLLLAIARARSN